LDDRPVLRDEPLERRGGARLRRAPRHVAAHFPPSVSGWPSHSGGGSSPTSLTIVGATAMTRGLSSAIGRLQKKSPRTSDGSIGQWSPLQPESLSNTTCSAAPPRQLSQLTLSPSAKPTIRSSEFSTYGPL